MPTAKDTFSRYPSDAQSFKREQRENIAGRLRQMLIGRGLGELNSVNPTCPGGNCGEFHNPFHESMIDDALSSWKAGPADQSKDFWSHLEGNLDQSFPRDAPVAQSLAAYIGKRRNLSFDTTDPRLRRLLNMKP